MGNTPDQWRRSRKTRQRFFARAARPFRRRSPQTHRAGGPPTPQRGGPADRRSCDWRREFLPSSGDGKEQIVEGVDQVAIALLRTLNQLKEFFELVDGRRGAAARCSSPRTRPRNSAISRRFGPSVGAEQEPPATTRPIGRASSFQGELEAAARRPGPSPGQEPSEQNSARQPEPRSRGGHGDRGASADEVRRRARITMERRALAAVVRHAPVVQCPPEGLRRARPESMTRPVSRRNPCGWQELLTKHVNRAYCRERGI